MGETGRGVGLGAGGLGELTRLVERLSEAVGASRARQLRWVAGELALYQEWVPATDLAMLLEGSYLRAYLAAAERGMLRRRGPVGVTSPAGAARVRRVCLSLLASAARLPDPDVGPLPGSVLRNKVTPTAAQRAMRVLVAEAREEGARPGVVRAALVAALVHHHDLRTGEIIDLTLTDVEKVAIDNDADDSDGSDPAKETAGERVVVTYRPAAPGIGPGQPTTIVVAPVVAELLDRWLVHRDLLVPVPRVRHLLVSVHGNHHGGIRKPPGLPLQPRGLMRAHASTVARLNEVLADRYGHEPDYTPLPRTLGELRPAVTVETIAADESENQPVA